MLSIKERLLRHSLISCLVFNRAAHLFSFEIIEDTQNKFESSLITFDMIDTPSPFTFDKIEEPDLFALDIYGQATYVPELNEAEPQYIHVTDYTVIQWNDTLISAKKLQAFIEAGAFTSSTPLSSIHEIPENTQLVVLDDNPHFVRP